MTAPKSSTSTILRATPAEQHALSRLRERYQYDHDLFSNREWNHLSFLRWLYRTGRLQP